LIKRSRFDKIKKKLSKKFNKFYRINQYIKAEKVRVCDEKGKQIGVMSLQEALKRAEELKVDLVEVAPQAIPPVCRLIDFKKFKYLEAKKEQEEKKKAKKSELKEIRLTLFMAENDLNFRLKRAEEFIKEGHKVKISLRFKGRQVTKKDLGYQLIQKVLEKTKPYAQVEVEPRFLGNQLETIMTPLKVVNHEKTKTEN
jgi:translation initiation factor IF-3